jgi:hypothetical protein
MTKSGRSAPPEEKGPKPGWEALQERIKPDPAEKWVPTELGRCPQRDDPSCAGGTMQDVIIKGNPGALWIPEGIGRSPQRDDPPCESGMAHGKLNREDLDQGGHDTENLRTTDV